MDITVGVHSQEVFLVFLAPHHPNLRKSSTDYSSILFYRQ